MGFAARLLYPAYRPRTFISPGFQDSLGLGYAAALGVQDARRELPVVAIAGDGGFMFTATEMATAVHHRIPLTAVVFNDGAFGKGRRNRDASATGLSPATSATRISCALARALGHRPSVPATRSSCEPLSSARLDAATAPA
jgi:thiamine pyrophosphate-dependent acetolactate synthase large subunit-like protein